MSKNLKILFVTPFSITDHGGVQNQIMVSKQYLLDKGYKVRIYSHGSTDYENYPTIKVRFNSSVSKITIACNKELLKEAINRADIIHIHEPFIPLIIWRIRTKKKIITTHHASLNNKFLHKALRLIYNSFFRSHSITSIAVSKESYLNASSLSEDAIIISNYYMSTSSYNHNKGSKEVTFVGRNEKRKGLKVFLESIDNNLVGKYKFNVITNTEKFDTKANFFIDINDSMKNEILRNTKILVAPNTKHESFGIVLLEGILNGALAVCSDLPAFKSVLGNSGIYFNTGDSKDLNSTLNELFNLNTDELWKEQYNHISKYDIENVYKDILKLYKNPF